MPYKDRDVALAYARSWYAKNAERLSRERDTDEFRAKRRTWWRKQDSHRRRLVRYGLTVAEHESMVLFQGGRCLLCWHRPCTDVDHDHQTGKVRGILCNPCNRGIGWLNDDIALLLRAASYLVAPEQVSGAI